MTRARRTGGRTSGAELERRDQRSPAPYRDSLDGLAAAWLIGFRNAATRAAYASDLRDFAAWCRRRQLELVTLTRPHVDAYARDLEAAGRAPATVARRLAALASFFEFCVDEGVLPRAPTQRIRRPRVDDESPTLGLDRAELARFLAAAERVGPRAYALACLLALNGLRVSEACGADVDDLDQVRGHRVLAVTRKRGKRAHVPLAPRTIAALEDLVGDATEGSLLLSDHGGRLDRHSAARLVGRIAREAEIAKRITPHSLRHAFVTLSLDAGVSLRDVQDAAGHADPRTTRRYDRARQALDRHPTYRLASFVDVDASG